jgi:hypothetical protein
MPYLIELAGLIATTVVFTYMARGAINEAQRIIFTFGALFSMLAFVGMGIAATNALGMANGVLDAVFLLVIIIVIFEVCIDIIELVKPVALLPIRKKWKGSI